MPVLKVIAIVLTAVGAGLLIAGWKADRFMWLGATVGAAGIALLAVA